MITRLDVQGGAEVSTLLEIEELAARGHEVELVTVVAPTTEPAARRLDDAGVRHRHLDGSVFRQARQLRQLISSWRPSVVHAVIFRAEVVTAIAAVGSGVATIVSLVNMQYDGPAMAEAPSPRRLELVRRFESKVLLHGIDEFHCLTVAGEVHSVDRLGLPVDRITVIPRGRRRSDVTADPGGIAAVSAEFDHRPLILNIGRRELQKGQDLLLQAARLLKDGHPDIAVAIAGRDGNESSALDHQRTALGLNDTVSFLDARADVAELIGASTVVCVTSRWEGLGGAIVEALGVGAPVVAFAVPAVAEVVGDAGMLVDPFDVQAFADAVDGLLGDERRRVELAEAGRRRFDEQFEISTVIDRIEALYARIAR